MKLKRITALLTTGLLLLTLPILALAQDGYGSSAVVGNQNTYTLEQMLTYAIQDETMAQAEYQKILAAYGDNNAFANIVQAEGSHIAELTELFRTNGIVVPENTAAQQATLPVDLTAAYTAGVAAENANIAMYETFLSQTNLPQDVRTAFAELMNASESHLTALTRNVERTGNGQGMRNGFNDETVTQGDNDTCMDTQRQGMNSRMGMMQGNSKNQRYNNNQSACDGTCDGTNSSTGNGTCDGTCDETNQNTNQNNTNGNGAGNGNRNGF
ncbi:MAG: hypothetical protein LLF96_09860 [Eubacteriales bacterium]|nr:hypothetical protein [Eubacteriales bacterium]